MKPTQAERLAAKHQAQADKYRERALLHENAHLSKLAAIVRAFDRWMVAHDSSGDGTVAADALEKLYTAELAAAKGKA
jgi:hypothetical protein